jgi:hypothetical protein
VLDILDVNDLTSTQGAQQFAVNKDLKELRSFIEGFRHAMLEDPRSAAELVTIDQANYLPSSSLRGDSGCAAPPCRLSKVRAMARYVALYCDKAIVPVRFPLFSRKTSHSAEILSRYGLLGTILGIMEMRPLIEAGLITLVPEDLRLCVNHWKEGVPERDRILAAARTLADQNAKRFTLTYYPPEEPRRLPSIHYKGPEEFLEHGEIRHVLDSAPDWLSGRQSSRPLKLSQSTIKAQNLVFRFFHQIANDAFLQSYFGTAFDARYVTDSRGESDFFQILYKRDELALRTTALCAHLTHSVPLMTDIPIAMILRVRQREPEAFQNYRSAVTGIVKEYAAQGKTVGVAEAKEIYTELLKPQLNALETQAKNVRREQVRKGLLKVAASSVLIGVGIYSGVLPSQLTNLVTAIGGFNVAKDLAESLAAMQRNPAEIRNNNLYFLLRLKQEAKG